MLAKWTLLIIAAMVVSGCQLGHHWDDEKETLYVDFYKVPCDDDESRLCFRSREKETDGWRNDGPELSEFDQFEWGYRYELEVETSFNSNGNASRYRFLSVEEKTAITSADNTFALKIDASTGIVSQSGSEWLLHDKAFSCSNDCSALNTMINNSQLAELEFQAQENSLTLTQIKCSAGEDNYDEECGGKKEVTWDVAHFLSDCGNADGEMCYLYRLNSSDDWELLPVDIEGFEHTWGNEYEIEVKETRSDTGRITAATLKQEDAAPRDRSGQANDFYFVLQGRLLDDSNDGKVTLYDSADLTLSCGSACNNLDDYIEDDDWLLLQAYVSENGLVLEQVACHADTLNLLRQCDENVDWDF